MAYPYSETPLGNKKNKPCYNINESQNILLNIPHWKLSNEDKDLENRLVDMVRGAQGGTH